MKRILFIAPKFMDIYKDILTELEKNYLVDFIPEISFHEDPNNIRCYKGIKKLLYVRPARFKSFNRDRWQDILKCSQYNKVYDILFVLDGQSIDECVFQILKERNPDIYCVNYLFDTTTGVYRFDLNFCHFNAIYTFDIAESSKYGIYHLPIYWKQVSENTHIHDIVLYGLGRFSTIRYQLFCKLQNIAKKNNIPCFIKLVTDKEKYMWIVRLKWIIRVLTRKTYGHIPPSFYKSDMNTYQSTTPTEFRQQIINSEIIIDTNAPHQDGLTARFMWALGLGKKIITTNTHAREYPFYSDSQILIIDNLDKLNETKILDFIKKPLHIEDDISTEVAKVELANWIKTILSTHK